MTDETNILSIVEELNVRTRSSVVLTTNMHTPHGPLINAVITKLNDRKRYHHTV